MDNVCMYVCIFMYVFLFRVDNTDLKELILQLANVRSLVHASPKAGTKLVVPFCLAEALPLIIGLTRRSL